MTPQDQAAQRVAARRDRIKSTAHITKVYKDHYTIDYNAPKRFVVRRPPQYTHGPSGWFLTKSGKPI